MIKESCVSSEVLRCIQVGLLCVQEEVVDRPTMLVVHLMLSSERLDLVTGASCSINEVTITNFEAR